MTDVILYIIYAMYFATVIFLLFAFVSLVVLCINWKTDHRLRLAKRLGISLLAVLIMIAATYCSVWYVWMPLVGSEVEAQHAASRAKRLSETTLVKLGDPSPKFSLKTLSGETLDVPQPNRVLVVSFFATWCGPCLNELPHLQTMWQSRKRDDRFQMLVISREETEKEVRDFLNNKGYTFPAAVDPERFFFSKFATESIPRTFVIGPDGLIAHASMGFTEGDQNELEEVIGSLLDTMPGTEQEPF